MTRAATVFFPLCRKCAACGLGRRLLLLALLAVAVLLAACEGDRKEDAPMGASSATESRSSVPSVQTPPAASAVVTAPEPPLPTPEERDRADVVVAFYNDALNALASGRYGQVDLLMAQTRYYLQEWQLLPRPEASGEEDKSLARRLAPSVGLLPESDTARLAQESEIMAKTAASIRADYRALERYVQDDSIQDDGVKGRALAASMEKAHADFVAARESYVRIVEEHAVRAEDVLLRGHPLRRQILAAERMFAVYGAVARLLAPPVPDATALHAQQRDLEEGLDTAGRPPFLAPPEVERLFRAFLKTASQYTALLAQGLEANLFSAPLRQRMNDAVLSSRAAYNAFVRAANNVH